MRSRSLALSCGSVLVTGTLLLGSASPASAVVEVEDWGDVLDVRVLNEPARLRIRCEAGRVHVEADTPWNGGHSRCELVKRIQIHLDGGQDDVVELAPYSDPMQFRALTGITVDSGPDGLRDEIRGSWGADQVSGDGPDSVHTGAGDDRVWGDLEGPGEVVAGEGDDTIESGVVFDRFGGPSDVDFQRRVIDGGPGVDAWTAQLQLIEPTSVLNASGLSTGTRTMRVQGIEKATLRFTRRIEFDAELFPGTLVLTTQDSADRLVGTRNHDVIRSGGGDDWVWVRDGVADTVDCGAGVDTVVADVTDVVTGCETVTLPPVPAAPPAPPVPPSPGQPAPTPPGTPVTPPGTPVPPPGAPGGPVVLETGGIKAKKRVAKPRRATFRFSSPTPGATFECKVDRRTWNPCAGPYRVETRRLKAGAHLFRVRAVLGGEVDGTPSRWRFRVTRPRR